MSRVNKKWGQYDLDSDEEYLFLCWLKEAQELGFVKDVQWVLEPQYELSDRVATMVNKPLKTNPDKMKEQFLLHPHSYKADVAVTMVLDKYGAPLINKIARKLGRTTLQLYPADCANYNCVFDVKCGYMGGKGGTHSSDITFPVNQKWVYQMHHIFVNKAVIDKKKGIFPTFWAPKEAYITLKGNPSKIYANCRTIDDIKKLI